MGVEKFLLKFYTRDEETFAGMKIISMDRDILKKIIKNKLK